MSRYTCGGTTFRVADIVQRYSMSPRRTLLYISLTFLIDLLAVEWHANRAQQQSRVSVISRRRVDNNMASRDKLGRVSITSSQSLHLPMPLTRQYSRIVIDLDLRKQRHLFGS